MMKSMQHGHQYYIKQNIRFNEGSNQLEKITTNTKEQKINEKQDGDSDTEKDSILS